MPTRLDPGINAHPIPAGVVLSTDEWARLTAPLELGPDRTLEEVFHVLAGRIDASYNVAHTVRELLDAGEPGTSVPPTDLPGAIRRIGQARHRAEQQAKQFAGEVADLTDRLERVLPDVFHAVIRDVAFDRGERQAELQWEDIEESAELALTLTLSLLTSYDVRDRDQARPVTPAEFYDATRDQARPVDTSAAARRFTVTLDGDPTTTFAPAGPGSVANAEPVTLTPPANTADYWTRPGQPTPAWTELRLWGVPVNADHPVVVYLTDHLGPLKGCSGSYDCRRALIANVLRDAADEVRVATSTTGAPHEDWIRRSAERLADVTDPPDPALGSLARLIRDASSYARNTIDRAKPCTICDGVGGVYGTHRLGCPNATPAGTT